MPFKSSQSAADALTTSSPVPVFDKASLTDALPGLGRASQSLLFVDGGVADYRQLVAGAAAGRKCMCLTRCRMR